MALSITIEKMVERRHKFLPSVLSLNDSKPIYMNRAAFQYMYDADLDKYINIPMLAMRTQKFWK